MPVIVDNPRYERLAQCLAAGMRQAEICRELDYSDTHVCELSKNERIRTRLAELLEQHAQKALNTGAIATIAERKALLSSIANAPHETPLTAGQRIAAAKELNLMEHVYEQTNTQIAPITINVVLPAGIQASSNQPELPASEPAIEGNVRHNLYSANQLPPPKAKKKRARACATPPTSDSGGAGG